MTFGGGAGCGRVPALEGTSSVAFANVLVLGIGLTRDDGRGGEDEGEGEGDGDGTGTSDLRGMRERNEDWPVDLMVFLIGDLTDETCPEVRGCVLIPLVVGRTVAADDEQEEEGEEGGESDCARAVLIRW